MRIIFAGTPEFAVPALSSLIESDHELICVYTQADRKSGRGQKITAPPVKQTALAHDIPVRQPDTLKTAEEIDRLIELNADLMVVVAYGMLLPQATLDAPRLGCINIHASLLPRWRGAAPIQRAIQAGDKQTGVSIMQMELGLDTGPVICEKTLDIDKQDTSASLHDKLATLGPQALLEALPLIEAQQLDLQAQDDALATYAKKLTKPEATIDWTQPADLIDCSIRAFNPWPVCQTTLSGQRVRIWFSELINIEPQNEVPGTVIEVDELGISVACGVGIVRLIKLQRDGGKPLDSAEFINGFTISAGQRLGDT